MLNKEMLSIVSARCRTSLFPGTDLLYTRAAETTIIREPGHDF